MKKGIIVSVLFILLTNPAIAVKREIPQKPDVRKWQVSFNREALSSYSVVYDVRTATEKKQNLAQGRVNGNVILLIHGQQQRPQIAFEFVSKLALNSKSGIVVVPVVDTPFGKDSQWRGDKGKIVILMEMARQLLAPEGIRLDGYTKITEMPVLINNQEVKESGIDTNLPISSKLTIMGWSHGGLLARRIASAYPGTIKGLAQITPAGYIHWGYTRVDKTVCLLSYFFIECANIAKGILTGQLCKVMEATWGLSSGTIGDSLRSPSTCLTSHFHVLKPFRPVKDMHDCTFLADHTGAQVSHLKHIVVMFGASDFVFHPTNACLPKKEPHITDQHRNDFWQTYFQGTDPNFTQRTVTILPGNHIGPMAYPDIYMRTALQGTGQLLQSPTVSLNDHQIN
ncbi:MAG: hypothetical protein OMM_03410 [Candidatus Magnetoglobus multicellularis str. Araruama]|uniref:AB hydrolase-1 domain-containing protein n=1 Tax=Candidatus Magnetoglobus multicellularis str. Araruama TaxID=890399 RepID=A0A1V1P5Y0_9BACT|nr:MAG: hypothetical protein OMM_03410 [Candidatus Magnetoglobus multicellularis str. Araruama]